VLAIDIDRQTVRGVVLANETPAIASGYAQLGYEPALGPVAFAARIAAALDVKATLPVAITCDPELGDEVIAKVVAAITAAGFSIVTVMSRAEAEQRANPDGGTPDALAGVQIPSGLLTSHAGLTVADLAPVVGAGLGLMEPGFEVSSAAEHDGSPDAVPVWSPTSEVPPAPDTYPFTSRPITPSAAAATAAAMADHLPAASSTALKSDTAGSKRLLVLLIAGVALLALVGLAISQCGGSDDTTTSTSTNPQDAPGAPRVADELTDSGQADTSGAETTETTEAPLVEASPAPTAVAEPTAVPTATSEPEPTPEPTTDPLEGLPPLSSLPERGAIFRPPTLFLEGPVQTQEQADELYARAIAVVGPDNVVNEYIVRPDAPPALDGNVRVEQAVLFQSGSAAIADDFIPTLELGVAVMALNPQVQMVVEGHTDSIGSAASNVALSQRRADAVVAYLVGRGVDLGRLEAVGLGEETPVADNNTAEGRQINRRIEVNLLDLLAGE